MSNIGKYFEKKIQDALKNLQTNKPCMYYRFPDATAARSAMTSQPADHMIAYSGTALLVEEKASEVHESLVSGASSLIGKKQSAMHLKWIRSGNKSIFIFYSKLSGIVEVWDGEYTAKCRAEGKKLDKALGLINCGDIKTVYKLLLKVTKL